MSGLDDRDDRLRRLFTRLPEAKAPADFEERVARAIARRGGRRTGWTAWPAWVRMAAVPGAALLLVGVISFLVLRRGPVPSPEAGQSDIPAETTAVPQPAAASPSSGISPSNVQKREEGVPAPSSTPAGPPTRRPAETERKDADRLAPSSTGTAPAAAPAPPPVTTPLSKSRPSGTTAPPAPPGVPSNRAKAAKQAPSLLMMEGPAIDSATADSIAKADSAARRDSLLRRLLKLPGIPPIPPDSAGLRDSTAGRDSTGDRNSVRGASSRDGAPATTPKPE